MKKKFFIITALFIFALLLFGNLILEKRNFTHFKNLFDPDQKKLIKKYVFPHKLLNDKDRIISVLESEIKKKDNEINKINNFLDEVNLSYVELLFKDSLQNIKTSNIEKFSFNEHFDLYKYKLTQGFYSGIQNKFPGSGYIDFHEENMFILSSSGILAFSENIGDESLTFKQIKNNINDFINLEQFNKGTHNIFSLKDLLIDDKKIYISLTEEIKEDCWNTSIISGEINYDEINFEKIFTPSECIYYTKNKNWINNQDKEFSGHQSGGRMIKYKDSILFTIGEYRSRYLAQNTNSVNGKIIKISLDENKNYKIISMGHRNPQGLLYDKLNNFLLETEHGPMGGDEINLIEIDDINKNVIPNYGWPKVSAGEHYGGKVDKNKFKYEKYPLYKSHEEYGFIEPLISFVPSIGISQIVKIKKNKYLVSSLKDMSLYFFELDKNKKLTNLKRVQIDERVRDMILKDNKIYLFLETSASIGLIHL